MQVLNIDVRGPGKLSLNYILFDPSKSSLINKGDAEPVTNTSFTINLPADLTSTLKPGNYQLLQAVFGRKGGMKRFAVAEDERLRAGFTRILQGGAFKTYFWYDEIWYVIDGRMQVTASTRSENRIEKFMLRARDAFYIPTELTYRAG